MLPRRIGELNLIKLGLTRLAKTTFLQPTAYALSCRMSAPPPDKSALPDPSYHWTTRKASVFLGALADLGRVGEAAHAVGMARQSAYRLRERLGGDSLFARAWDRALQEGQAQRRARRSVTGKVTALPPESDIFGLGK